mgnify:CR=1 FL=1
MDSLWVFRGVENDHARLEQDDIIMYELAVEIFGQDDVDHLIHIGVFIPIAEIEGGEQDGTG